MVYNKGKEKSEKFNTI